MNFIKTWIPERSATKKLQKKKSSNSETISFCSNAGWLAARLIRSVLQPMWGYHSLEQLLGATHLFCAFPSMRSLTFMPWRKLHMNGIIGLLGRNCCLYFSHGTYQQFICTSTCSFYSSACSIWTKDDGRPLQSMRKKNHFLLLSTHDHFFPIVSLREIVILYKIKNSIQIKLNFIYHFPF